MTLVGVGFGAQLLSSLLYLAGVWATSRAFGVAVQRLQVGMGPAFLKRDVGSVTLALGVVPLGSYVQFVRDPSLDPDDASTDPPPDAFEKAGRGPRVAIAIAGLAGMALLPLLGLGPIEGALSIAHGVPQVVLGAISPFGTARHLIEAADALPRATLVAVLGAKILAYNLLPLPGTNLWVILRSVLGFRWERGCLVGLVPVAFALSWLVALGAWALG